MDATKRLVLLVAVLIAVCSAPRAAFGQSACSLPQGLVNNDPDQTAWAIFVAAACQTATPNQYPYLTWETWIEQAQEYPAASNVKAQSAAKAHAARRFHGSPLAMVFARRSGKAGLPQVANQDCGPGQGNPNVIFCEEVRLSPVAQSYVSSPAPFDTLAFRGPQAQFATAPPPPWFPPNWANIQFPWPAIEVKVDWIQYTGSCPSGLNNSVWTETIGGNCYALAGMHIISKLLPNWIWATFEPQNMTTNSQRCVVLGCNDPFGSNPAQTPPGKPGTTTQITPQLQSMMTAANLNPVWQNYRMDGVQTAFVDSQGNPTLLGNSIIEGENVGMPLNQASCITCHAVSSIKADGTDGITNLTSNFIGNPPPYPPGFAPRDFVWSLSMACPNSPFGSVSNCPASQAKQSKKK